MEGQARANGGPVTAPNVTFRFALPPDLREWISDVAREQGCSDADVVRYALNRYRAQTRRETNG